MSAEESDALVSDFGSDYEPSSDEAEEDILEEESQYESSDNEDTDDNPDYSFYSKDKREVWRSIPLRQSGRQPSQNVMHMKGGPSRHANRNVDSIESAFDLFLTPVLLREIVKWTNKEGKRVYANNWKDLDEVELRCFIGLLIISGVEKANNEPIIQLWNREDGRPIFSKSMARNRFQEITRCMRFDDAEKRRTRRPSDKLAPIRFVFEKWVSTLQECYTPYENVTIDEQLVSFHGKCPFRQYMPSKPAKYGIKFWNLCDSKTYYVWKMQIYTGRNASEQREVNQGKRVVLNLIEGLEKSGRNITCDNFFTSLELLRELKEKQLSILGTLRKNKKEIPIKLLQIRGREPFSSVFAFQESASMVSYCPKKGRNVLLLSSMHFQPEISNTDEKKPLMILDYNSTKSGVDTMDKMVMNYTTKRKTKRWPMVVFYNMLDISALNAFVIWNDLNSSWNIGKSHRRRLFLLDLGKSLVMANKERRATPFEPPESSKKGKDALHAIEVKI